MRKTANIYFLHGREQFDKSIVSWSPNDSALFSSQTASARETSDQNTLWSNMSYKQMFGAGTKLLSMGFGGSPLHNLLQEG